MTGDISNELSNDLLAFPEHSAIRFSFDVKSVSFPLYRFQAMARLWLLRGRILASLENLWQELGDETVCSNDEVALAAQSVWDEVAKLSDESLQGPPSGFEPPFSKSRYWATNGV